MLYDNIYSYVTIFVFLHKSFSCRPESARYKEWMKEMQSTANILFWHVSCLALLEYLTFKPL